MMRRWLTALPLLLGLGLASAAEAPRVVVSIKPIHSLVAGLMQGVGEPTLLVGNGATPYDFRLDAADRVAIERADLVIWVGAELEGFLAESLRENSGGQVLELLGIERLKILPQRDNPELRDPYFWLDSRNGLMLLDLLSQTLAGMDPARSHVYLNNRKRLFSELAEIDRTFEYGYRGVSGRPVLLYHDTQQYFEQAYAMRSIGHLSPAVGGRAAAQNLLQARGALGESEGRVCLFTEYGLPDGQLELLGDLTRLKVVQLDSLGTALDAGPGHYLRLLSGHFQAIKGCVTTP